MIESYEEARVVLADSGELFLALPIYANQTGVVFDARTVRKMIKDKKFPGNAYVGLYEHMGYLLYNPFQPMAFYMNSLKLFQDLGTL